MTGNAGINDATGAIELPILEDEPMQNPNVLTKVEPAPTPTLVSVNDVDNWKPDDFPFQLSDLAGWVIKNKDGSVVRYVLTQPPTNERVPHTALPAHYSKPTTQANQSWGSMCHHNPAPHPVYEHVTPEGGKVQLFIADSVGARAFKDEFDIVIDGGDAIHPYKFESRVDGNDPTLVDFARDYEWVPTKGPKIIHIAWGDRQAPPVYVQFWTALAKEFALRSNEQDTPLKILTVCQGGHGRSGTALVSLMMAYTDYTPLDAITHLRAVHCPRAIESKIQHDYLNALAGVLGRKQNAHDADQVKDFKARFMKEMTSEFASVQQERLKAKGATADTVKRDEDDD